MRHQILKRLIPLFLLTVLCSAIFTGTKAAQIAPLNEDAFVYIQIMGFHNGAVQFRGTRVGFAVGDGKYILTAAHCVEDIQNTNQTLIRAVIISPYYDNLFEAKIVAVDAENDIAILEPAWDYHPALKLATSEQWKNSKRIAIAGYPPNQPCRGGNGLISRKIMVENEKLVDTNENACWSIQLGPVKYPGKGWSGSAFVVPQTGHVVGLLSREKYLRKFFRKRHYIYGPDVSAIKELFEKHHLAWQSKRDLPPRQNGNNFEHILNFFDLIESHRHAESKNSIKQLCANNPDSHILHLWAAWVLEKAEEETYYSKIIEMAPENDLAHAAYGLHLLSDKKHKQAAEQFEAAIELDPNHIFAYTGYMQALENTDAKAAEALGIELTERWPKNAGFWFEMGKSLRKQKKHKEELSSFQKAIELSEKRPYVYQRYLADAFTSLGMYPEAETAYQKLLKEHECEVCWKAYTALLVLMGSEKQEQARIAIKKTKSANTNGSISKAWFKKYESRIEKMSEIHEKSNDPNSAASINNHPSFVK